MRRGHEIAPPCARKAGQRLEHSHPARSLGGEDTELKRAAHRNRQTKWKSNDLIDIDAMSLAVPYCDVVVTEWHRRISFDRLTSMTA